jgi:hypothetical protein
MMRSLDRALAILLALGAGGHTMGSLKAFGHRPDELLWALCASLLVLLLAALNYLRTYRAKDRALAWIVAAGMAGWFGAAIAFGLVIHNLLDPRPVVFSLISLGLIAFSLKDALATGPGLRARTAAG